MDKCERCGESVHPDFTWKVESDHMDMKVCIDCAAYAQVFEERFRFHGHIKVRRLVCDPGNT